MIWVILIALIHLAGLLTALRAVMGVRTAQGAIAWAIALITVPYLSLPVYLIFGRNKFHGYTVRRRAAFFKTDPVAKKCAKQLLERELLAAPDRNRAFLVERLVNLPFTTHNEAELLIDGEATYRSILAGIDQARAYILIEFYILRDDATGRGLQQRLIAKVREGIAVYMLYDEIGSKELSASYQEELVAAGVAIHPFNTRQGPSNRWQLNFRNHRKIVVVDGRSAWIGGLNIGDEYLGRDPEVGIWRDTHVKLTGPSVAGAQIAFLEDWHWATHEVLSLRWEMEPAPGGAQSIALCVPSGPADSLETCTLFFLHAINSAKERLWIASPYFVPDEQFISALQLAALRGVDVRVLIPHKSDNKLVQLSIWSYVAELETVGIRMFQHREGFMHQKVMLIDDYFATIGTANFDNRSFRLNFEITAAIIDEAFAGCVQKMLEDDFAGSQLITTAELATRGWWFRLCSRIARLMAPVQ